MTTIFALLEIKELRGKIKWEKIFHKCKRIKTKIFFLNKINSLPNEKYFFS